MRERVRIRFLLTREYISIYFLLFLVYASFFLFEYALIRIVGWLLSDPVQKYALVSLWYDYLQIALAILIIILSGYHGIMATRMQMKVERAISDEADSH